jgi:hypothetical protein
MQSQFSILKSASLSLTVSLLLTGCGGAAGPELGKVSGRVTLDGQPLANAVVRFQPAGAGGTYSTGRTDADGNYQLRYSRDQYGALIGSHRVSVSTAAPDAEDKQGNPSPVRERVPVQYNAESSLIHEVEAGSNEIDLELSGVGRIAGAPRIRR